MSLPVTLPLIDHLALRVRDVRRSRTFYERALEPFGVKVVESSQGPGFAIEGGGDFWIGEGEPPAAPVHVAFAAADRATVDKFHRAAVEAGGRDNGAPGLRPHYHAGYYAAFVIDPDGNNVEAVFHGTTASCQPRDARLRQRSGMTPEPTVQDETADNSDDSPADGIQRNHADQQECEHHEGCAALPVAVSPCDHNSRNAD